MKKGVKRQDEVFVQNVQRGLRHLWMFMVEHHLVWDVWKWKVNQRDWWAALSYFQQQKICLYYLFMYCV